MKYINKNDLSTDALPGRGLKRAIGKNSYFDSERMTVGYASYQAKFGIMEPHSHVEETVIVTDVSGGWVSWGPSADALNETLKLEKGMVLHIPDNEWHVFTYDEGGFVEIIFIYSGVDNIRPEDN